MGLSRALAALLVCAGLLVAAPVRAHAAPVAVSPPVVLGEAVYASTLRVDEGTWEPADVSLDYQWLRAGEPVPGAVGRTYDVGLGDLGRRLRVEVTATDANGASSTARSQPTERVRRADLRVRREPSVLGRPRYGRVVSADPGRTAPAATRATYRWLVAGEAVAGQAGRSYRPQAADVGRKVRAVVTLKAPGYRRLTLTSPGRRVHHRVAVRRTVTYSVQTRGRITTSLRAFRRQAQETYLDARGWRGSGVRFRPVPRGGSFTLVLAAASQVPTFSPVCSATWSCRVGRYVIINQERWKHASPAWNAAGGRLRDYRHMVVNHETGHWLGRGHASCPGAGQPAPVMQQQSKGLGGCRFNAWPTVRELR